MTGVPDGNPGFAPYYSAEKLSTAEAAWRGGGGVAILFTDVCIPSTQSSSCSKNIC